MGWSKTETGFMALLYLRGGGKIHQEPPEVAPLLFFSRTWVILPGAHNSSYFYRELAGRFLRQYHHCVVGKQHDRLLGPASRRHH